MERMEHVKRAMVNGVRLQILGGRIPPVEGGSLCITAFFLIFSTRQSSKDEITVRQGKASLTLSSNGS